MTVATIYASRDATGQSTSAGAAGTTGTVANPTSVVMSVGTISGCSGVSYNNAFLYANFASLAGKYVTAASFNYWLTTVATPPVFQAFRATSDWVEVDGSTGPTFSLVGATGALPTGPTGAYAADTDAKWKEWIQNWIDGAYPNYGFVLDWVSGTGYVQISSSDEAGTTQDPYFSVTYTSKPTITPTGVPSPSTSVPQAGDVSVSFTFSDPDGDTLSQVAIRRVRLTGA